MLARIFFWFSFAMAASIAESCQRGGIFWYKAEEKWATFFSWKEYGFRIKEINLSRLWFFSAGKYIHILCIKASFI